MHDSHKSDIDKEKSLNMWHNNSKSIFNEAWIDEY